jgi:hypothetical protein
MILRITIPTILVALDRFTFEEPLTYALSPRTPLPGPLPNKLISDDLLGGPTQVCHKPFGGAFGVCIATLVMDDIRVLVANSVAIIRLGPFPPGSVRFLRFLLVENSLLVTGLVEIILVLIESMKKLQEKIWVRWALPRNSKSRLWVFGKPQTRRRCWFRPCIFFCFCSVFCCECFCAPAA